jgi:hypothetical protein
MARRLCTTGAVLGTAMFLLTGGSAHAADPGSRQTATYTFTSTQPGLPTGFRFAVDWRNPADPSGKPFALKSLVIRFPEGSKFDTSVPARCTAIDAELYLEGAAACPADSQVASGSVLADTGSTAGFPRFVPNQVWEFNNTGQVITLAESTNPPTRAVGRATLTDQSFSSSNTPFPGQPPPEPFTAFKSLRLSASPIVRDGRAYALTPPTCPDSGHWTIALTFGYFDGVTQTVYSHSPCAP